MVSATAKHWRLLVVYKNPLSSAGGVLHRRQWQSMGVL